MLGYSMYLTDLLPLHVETVREVFSLRAVFVAHIDAATAGGVPGRLPARDNECFGALVAVSGYMIADVHRASVCFVDEFLVLGFHMGLTEANIE